ncbi:MAG: alpha-galactosidase [Planctomycetota bacterium]
MAVPAPLTIGQGHAIHDQEHPMIKVSMIGAGSVVFARNLTGDILSMPEFADATIAYMDIDAERLDTAGRMGRKVADALGVPARIETHSDRRAALQDADFVINMVQIGGFDSTLVDFEIPRRYGLRFTIADTTGPGALFRALRTWPLLTGLCADMEELCPRAVLLNYSNPMCMNMQSVFRSSRIQAVGLCHSVQGTLRQLMGYIDVDADAVSFTCAGINHMAFYLRLEHGGEDLYPRLFQAMADERIRATNKVRFELMRRLGYFVTESSEHNAEYNAHFIPHGQEVIDAFDIPIDEYLQRCDGIVDEFARVTRFARSDEPVTDIRRSHEYGSTIIHSMVTGSPSVIYGNLMNRGAISNLGDDVVVEGPTLVDRSGLRLCQVGALPPQIIGYIQPHVIQHELFIRAVQEGRRDHIYQACMCDPLTAATLTTDAIVAMCDELVEAHGDLLPALPPHTLIPTSGRRFQPPSARELRASWDAAKAQSERDYLKDWRVVGPVAIDAGATGELVGAVAAAPPDAPLRLEGKELPWHEARSRTRGYVNLRKLLGPEADGCAYAVHDWDEIHERDAELDCAVVGSLRIWLDGEEVIGDCRADQYRDPQVEPVARTLVHLTPGSHRLVVACCKDDRQWGFGIRLPPANM